MTKHVADVDFKKEVLDHQGVVLVDFFAEWCGPCKMLAPIIDTLEKEFSDQKYEGKMKVVKVDVDASPETSMAFQIQSIPTLIFFKNGVPVATEMGFKTGDYLSNKMKNLLASK